MLAKITSKNQVTLPKAIRQKFGEMEYVDIGLENGCIVLTPVRMQPAADIRRHIAALGITETDIDDAVAWARRHKD